MGRFATGVTVVTTMSAEDSGVAEKIHGMTASAFLSVSLDPPLVLVSVDKRAHLHAMLSGGSRYGVSILKADQAAYSQHFAGFGAPDLQPEFTWVEGFPLLENALGYVIARVVDAHAAGDHTLYIGQVEYLAWDEGEPLLYFRGQYGEFHKQGA
ncbi:MAG: flavin reductase family protein [Caldilineaceae bacterium]|nr:flavin reductase family protein [Caldilineaceae bacterium]